MPRINKLLKQLQKHSKKLLMVPLIVSAVACSPQKAIVQQHEKAQTQAKAYSLDIEKSEAIYQRILSNIQVLRIYQNKPDSEEAKQEIPHVQQEIEQLTDTFIDIRIQEIKTEISAGDHQRAQTELDIFADELKILGVYEELKNTFQALRMQIPVRTEKPMQLNTDEYVVPDTVIAAFARAHSGMTRNQAMQQIALNTGHNPADKQTAQQIAELLVQDGYSTEQAKEYANIFRKKQTQIYSQKMMKGRQVTPNVTVSFTQLRMHEYIHHTMEELPAQQQQILKTAAETFLEQLKNAKHFGGPYMEFANRYKEHVSTQYLLRARSAWQEFYAYQAEGLWSKTMLEEFAKQYPQAYQLFRQVYTQAQSKVQ